MESKDPYLEGADLALGDGPNRMGLWHTHTPKLGSKKVGTIGACSLDNSESSIQLLKKGVDCLKNQHQCDIVIGPMNGHTWQKHRLIIESNQRAPFLLEPTEPNYYYDLFSEAGFSTASTYTSSSIDLTQELPDYSKLRNRILNANYTIRPLNIDRFTEELDGIFKLSLECFEDNFLYTPISSELFFDMYEKVRPLIDHRFILMAEHESELVGFVFCLPDLPHKETLIVKTLATSPQHRSVGLGTDLVARVQETAKACCYSEAIHALQFENNSSLRISQRFNGEVFRKYALMIQ